ncbi:hypothetical protein HDU83_002784 [Entophlyctis luteolus]|nr:hypothetical protein HDU83_002784 [Entophlyctis luteolus]
MARGRIGGRGARSGLTRLGMFLSLFGVRLAVSTPAAASAAALLVGAALLVSVLTLTSPHAAIPRSAAGTAGTTEVSRISRIIHHAHPSHTLPPSMQLSVDSWRMHNPHYEHILWDERESLDLIALHYPWFVDTYRALENNALRGEAARVFYMHKYGGVYVDLACVAYKPIEPLLATHALVLARMSSPQNRTKDDDLAASKSVVIPAAFSASRPGHDFWMFAAHAIMRSVQQTQDVANEVDSGNNTDFRSRNPFNFITWDDAFAEYMEVQVKAKEALDPIHIADTTAVFPASYFAEPETRVRELCFLDSGSFDSNSCRQLIDPDEKSFAIMHWRRD